MRLYEARWPIVAPDERLLTLDELKEKCGVKNLSNFRRWLIKDGFSLVLSRHNSAQLRLCVTRAEAAKIVIARRALGFAVQT